MSATSPQRHLVEIPWLSLATLFFFLYLGLKLSRPIRKIYRAPQAVAHLQGPPMKHWLMGSYSKRELAGGKFTHTVLRDIQQYGKVHGSVLLGRKPHIVVADPKVVNKVFLQAGYPKVPSSLAFMRRHVGRGLLGEDGEAHARQRKIASPAFTTAAVNAMHGTIKEKGMSLVERINRVLGEAEAAQSDGAGVLTNCAEHWLKMALDVIGSCGFGYEFNSLYEDCRTPLDDAFASLMASMSTGTTYAALRTRFGSPIEKIGRYLRIKEQVELDDATQTVRNVSRALVNRAKAQAWQDGDFSDGLSTSACSDTSSLIEAEDEFLQMATQDPNSRLVEDRSFGSALQKSTKDLLTLMVRANLSEKLKPSQRLSDTEMSGMVPAMLSAGHETSATALSWACYALTQPGHGQEVQRRLRAELLESQGSWRDNVNSLHGLTYLDAVTREVLRLHSPIRGMRRMVPYDDVLPLTQPITLADGTETKELVVRKGTVLFFSLIAINTDDDIWGDGSAFRPERWLDESHPYSDYDSPAALAAHQRRTLEGSGEVPLKNVWSSMMSFGIGPTNCIGMKIALMEIKMGLASMLSNFELLPPALPGQAPVELDYVIQIVAHPVVKEREKDGMQVPIRIRRLPNTSCSTPRL
ncbi:hypothetical protein OC861_004510 [Tilletia horrida]|nr:hypothetical protein OC845_004094 [Tilletia horrida]KAK0564022.1 hypothetical protein OC861_004510 [Tilletia horrida]